MNAKLDERKSLNLIAHVYDLIQELSGGTNGGPNGQNEQSDDEAVIVEKPIEENDSDYMDYDEKEN